MQRLNRWMYDHGVGRVQVTFPVNHNNIELISEIMNKPDFIRNVAIIGHVHHGKSTVTDSLIAKAGFYKKYGNIKAHFTDTRQDERENGFTVKSTSVPLVYFNSDEYDMIFERSPYLINVIDTPGYSDFFAEVKSSLRLSDGALLVVDYIEGDCMQTTKFLRQALAEKIKPVMFINKIDRGILEL